MNRQPSPIFSILAVLLCYVLFAAEAQAISGGPVYPGGSVSTTGIYAGVLNGLQSNSIGLFSVTIPRNGLGSGRAVVFRNGLFFGGAIQATADPASGKVSGLLNLQYAYVYAVANGGNTVIVAVTISAAGILQANLTSSNNRFSRGAIRLDGTALVTATAPPTDQPIVIDPSLLVPVNYTVVGFKQSEL